MIKDKFLSLRLRLFFLLIFSKYKPKNQDKANRDSGYKKPEHYRNMLHAIGGGISAGT